MSRSRRLRVLGLGAAATTLVAVAAAGGGSTYAAFSDFVVDEGNRVGAAHVAVGLPGAHNSDLVYAGLVPDVQKVDTLSIAYTGSIPADLALELDPRGASAYCEQAGDGTWSPRDGGAVELSLGSVWLDYCALLDPGASVPVATDVQPGQDLTVAVTVRLAPGTDHRFSTLTDTDDLTVTSRQTGVAGFSDWATGTLTIGTGEIGPQVPAECGSVGQYKKVILGTEGPDTIDAGNGKQIVLGLGGDDVIDGGNGKDCLVGGDGDDLLEGTNGKDILVGGAGTDTCHGGHAPDTVVECELPLPPARGRSHLQTTTEDPSTPSPSAEDDTGTDPDPEPTDGDGGDGGDTVDEPDPDEPTTEPTPDPTAAPTEG